MTTKRVTELINSDRLYLTDGGMETTLIFHDGIDLPFFASFDLLRTVEGTARVRAYYNRYLEIAKAYDLGFVLESPTWRANADWGAKLGYTAAALAEINRAAIALMHELREAHVTAEHPIVVSGNIGPRGDGYKAGNRMSADEAFAYHRPQVAVFAQENVDFVSAFTLNYVDEAIGVVRAAQSHGLPAVISFTVETDGCLPSGDALGEAIAAVDDATGGGPVYYMINCAHPTHFDEVLTGDWKSRIGGLRANASRRSHAELDEATELDIGDPDDLARRYQGLRTALPALKVVGGCCGTDERHIGAIAGACAHASGRAA